MYFNTSQITARLILAMVLPLLALASGCQNCCTFKDSNSLGLFSRNSQPDFASLLDSATREMHRPDATIAQRLAVLSGEPLSGESVGSENRLAANSNFQPRNLDTDAGSTATSGYTQTSYARSQIPVQSLANGGQAGQGQAIQDHSQPIVRTQSLDYFGFPDKETKNQETLVTNVPDKKVAERIGTTTDDKSTNVKSGFQLPNIFNPVRNRLPRGSLPIANINTDPLNALAQPLNQAASNAAFPANYADLDVYVAETQTGRINFGGAFNSDNGIVGQFSIDEKNFDISRWPRNFREIVDGTAWRGAGQQFRLELAPGTDVERYLVSFTEPYWLGTNYSFSASGYLFQRQFFDWDEERVGGRFSLGRRLTPDLSISGGIRLEQVTLDDPRVDTSEQLNANLGTSDLYIGNIGLIRDTRDSRVQPTEGSYFAITYSQAFGDFDFSRGDLDYRRYRLLYERPDGSGRHTISFGTKLGFTGSDTPVFENFFAGGFATLRGFEFRGASPLDGGARVGGEFQWLNTVEYTFPIKADDAIKGVLFCDFGTVEQEVEINSENFRVAPGFGLRVSAPGIGGGAPLAFDFAFPVSTAEGDDEKVFSFHLGLQR